MIGAAVLLVAAGASFAIWRAGWAPVARQDSEVQAQLARARAEAEEAKRNAKAEAEAAAKARRELEFQRAAQEKAKTDAAAKAEAESRAKAAAEAKAAAARAEARVAKASSAKEAPRRIEEPSTVVARAEPEPKPAAPAPTQEKAPQSTFLPRTLWGSAPKPAQESAPAQDKAPGGFLPRTLWGSAAKPAAARYDGFWTVTRSCDAYNELPPQVTSWRMNVQGGEFVVGSGVAGQPGYNEARGKPAEDGGLVLSGSGIAVTNRNAGKSLPVFFEGRLEGERFVLKGSIGDRACTLVLARR
jgi:hypothetical protein